MTRWEGRPEEILMSLIHGQPPTGICNLRVNNGDLLAQARVDHVREDLSCAVNCGERL